VDFSARCHRHCDIR